MLGPGQSLKCSHVVRKFGWVRGYQLAQHRVFRLNESFVAHDRRDQFKGASECPRYTTASSRWRVPSVTWRTYSSTLPIVCDTVDVADR